MLVARIRPCISWCWRVAGDRFLDACNCQEQERNFGQDTLNWTFELEKRSLGLGEFLQSSEEEIVLQCLDVHDLCKNKNTTRVAKCEAKEHKQTRQAKHINK